MHAKFNLNFLDQVTSCTTGSLCKIISSKIFFTTQPPTPHTHTQAHMPHPVVVLKHDGHQDLGWIGRVDGPAVAQDLREVGQRPAVVQVEVGDDHTGDEVVEAPGGAEELELWEPVE